MVADQITWETPPPSKKGGRGTRKWPQRLAALRERPGEWAKFGPYATAAVASGSVRLIAKWDDIDQFETAVRNIDRESWLFVRFVGIERHEAAS